MGHILDLSLDSSNLALFSNRTASNTILMGILPIYIYTLQVPISHFKAFKITFKISYFIIIFTNCTCMGPTQFVQHYFIYLISVLLPLITQILNFYFIQLFSKFTSSYSHFCCVTYHLHNTVNLGELHLT